MEHADPTDAVATTAEEEAYRFVLSGIRFGTFRAGERLVPEDIASRLGMSRMPVRDAFRRLASQGLLEIRPNRGAVVRGLDAQDVAEVFEMRAVLEAHAATIALAHIGPAELAQLEWRLQDMDARAGDISDWVTAHRDFHLYFCGLSRRPRLVAQIAALHVAIEPHMRLWLQAADKPLGSHDDHALILHALRRGQPELAAAVVRDHAAGTVPSLVALMGSEGAAPAAVPRHDQLDTV